MGRVGCGGQAWILGHHSEAMAVVQFKVMDQGDGGGNEKWMDLGNRINETWVVRKGKKAHMEPAPTEGKLRQQQTRGSGEHAVSSVRDRRCDMPVKKWVEMAGVQLSQGSATLRRGSRQMTQT